MLSFHALPSALSVLRLLRRWPIALAAVLLSLALLGGCASLGYYTQSINGQMEVLKGRVDAQAMIDDPATDEQLRERLRLALRIRAFASAELHLPDNRSYRTYADLGRPYVAWNVVATPEFSLEPVTWCFPVAGCVEYRGYFDRKEAERFAAGLRAEGHDVVVGAVPAYSTLGWFDDPLLNTMMSWPEPELAAVIFHELAHQQLYVSGDTAFNESFAVAVEREGVRRWMESEARLEEYEAFRARKRMHAEFIALAMGVRGQLQALYARDLAPASMRAEKQALFGWMREEYARMKEAWDGYAGYDGWMSRPLNNARLASMASYHEYVPAFRALLEGEDGDLARFYRTVRAIADLPSGERQARLESLLTPAVAEAPGQGPETRIR